MSEKENFAIEKEVIDMSEDISSASIFIVLQGSKISLPNVPFVTNYNTNNKVKFIAVSCMWDDDQLVSKFNRSIGGEFANLSNVSALRGIVEDRLAEYIKENG